jgi:hypothetical protein
MKTFGFPGILLIAIVFSLFQSGTLLFIPGEGSSFPEFQKKNTTANASIQIQQQLQNSEDTIDGGLKTGINPSLFYSTMPVLKANPSGNMILIKPDSSIRYHILEKQVIIINPFQEDQYLNMPLNLEFKK